LKASFLVEPGVIEIRDIEVPTPDDDQVLVKVAAVGVCGSDVHFYAHGNIGTMIMSEPFVWVMRFQEQSPQLVKMSTLAESVIELRLSLSVPAEPAKSAKPAGTTSAQTLFSTLFLT